MFRAPDDVVGVFALAFEEHVGLADGVGLRVDFLAVEVRGDLLAARGGEFDEGFLGDGEHAARANGAVVEQVSAGSDRIGDAPNEGNDLVVCGLVHKSKETLSPDLSGGVPETFFERGVVGVFFAWGDPVHAAGDIVFQIVSAANENEDCRHGNAGKPRRRPFI